MPRTAEELQALIIATKSLITESEKTLWALYAEFDELRRRPDGDIPTEHLETSVRLANLMRNENIVWLSQLTARTEKELLALPNLGRISLKEIKKLLAERGKSLRTGKSFNDNPAAH